MAFIGTVALVGNPNSGKSSLFNVLTGGSQKVGNFPGVTVERKTGYINYGKEESIRIIDMPGSYSLYPTASDEKLVTRILLDKQHPDHPDVIVYTADANHLEEQLLLFTQLIDLGFSVILTVNMVDELKAGDKIVRVSSLERRLKIPVIGVSSRQKVGLQALKEEIARMIRDGQGVRTPFYKVSESWLSKLSVNPEEQQGASAFRLLVQAHHFDWIPDPNNLPIEVWQKRIKDNGFEALNAQVEEIYERHELIQKLLRGVISRPKGRSSLSDRLDTVLTHWLAGPIIFGIAMLFVFQAIFAWASYPMDAIESGFGYIGASLGNILPSGWFNDLVTQGVIPGLSGVLIFVPQIAILFFLISLLDELGYMARAVYLFDHFFQRFGMNGRSVVALISGGACAIPAIMSTRTIADWKERLITILVTPFISCSARIPVYTVLVAFIVPYRKIGIFFNTQGLVFASLYILGIVAALLSAFVIKKVLRTKSFSFLIMDLPPYRFPDWTNVWSNVRSKVMTFVIEAGKIILMISIILWLLASYGPPKKMEAALRQAEQIAMEGEMTDQEAKDLIAAHQLEASFAGVIGQAIEPVIKPLGFDWKIGIALITSFAAREVFVGSMATIYSIGSEANEYRIREHLAKQRDPTTQKLIFDRPTALSLLLFFVFAMQCMSTLAVVKKETDSWKWPVIQFTFMTATAYVASWVGFVVMS